MLIYVEDTITYEKLQIPDDSRLCDLETITIQVKPKCAKPFVIIAWYRPSNHKIDDILNIEKVYKTETEVIISGDVNCDDLPDQDKNSIVAKLRGFYKQYQFRQLIKHPTRTTDKSSTLLDHSATNKPNFIILSGSKSIGFSDQDFVFGIHKISGRIREEPKIVNCRNTKHYTPKIFRKALSEASWEHILTAMDPNTMSELWFDQFTNILDQIAPFKQRKVKNCYAPYIDKDLRQTTLLRDFYKKKHAKFKDPSDWSAYKKLRNEANSQKKLKRKSYFSQKLEESRGNIKDTWKILNTAMGRKSKTTNINSLQVGSETFSEPGEIAKELNYHFGSVARKVLAKAPNNTSKPEGCINPDYYLSFIPKKKEPFKFKEITPKQIIKCVSKMKNSKSDKVPNMFLKDTM